MCCVVRVGVSPPSVGSFTLTLRGGIGGSKGLFFIVLSADSSSVAAALSYVLLFWVSGMRRGAGRGAAQRGGDAPSPEHVYAGDKGRHACRREAKGARECACALWAGPMLRPPSLYFVLLCPLCLDGGLFPGSESELALMVPFVAPTLRSACVVVARHCLPPLLRPGLSRSRTPVHV